MTDTPTRPFCGRAEELATLQRAYARLEAEAPAPQLVVLSGESGLGKTRIVQEFYAWLSAQRDGAGAAGYWPDRLSADENYRDVNPAAPCNAAVAPPFLWLGLPCRDQIEGLDGYAAKLQPHLEPLRRLRERRDWAGEVAQKGIGMVPIIGPIIAMLFDLLKVGGGAKVWKRGTERSAAGFADADKARHRQAVDRLIESLGDFLDAPAGALDVKGAARAVERSAAGFRRVPAVLVVDDAQWADRSPAIVQLVERLLARAAERGWPLLLIATHWEREWKDRIADPASFAGVASRWATARDPDWAPTPVRPQPGDVYDALVRKALPGLPPEQRAVLLDRAGGNPRLLEEIVQHARINERLFVGRDPAAALSEAGLAELRAARFDLHELIARRLAAAPRPVRAAAGLSAAQGLQFAEAFTVAAAQRLGAEGVAEGIRAGVDPHALIFPVDEGVYAFAQGAYREVARADLANLFDPNEVRQVLADLVRADAADPVALAARPRPARRQARQAAVALLDGSPDPADRGLSAALFIELGADAADDWDYLTAVRYAEEAAAVPGGLDELPGWLRSERVSSVGHALLEMRRTALARQLAEAMWRQVRASGVSDVERVVPLSLLFAAIDKRDGQGSPRGERDKAMIEGALRGAIGHGDATHRQALADELAKGRQLEDALAEAVARSDGPGEIAARLALLRRKETLAETGSLPLAMIPILNDDRLDILARALALAQQGVAALDGAAEAALLADICRDARRHLAAEDNQDVRASAIKAVVRAADAVAARGRPGALGSELMAVQEAARRFADGMRSPVACHWAYRVFKHLAEAAITEGVPARAFDEAVQALHYFETQLALDPNDELRIEVALLLKGIGDLAGQVGNDGGAWIDRAVAIAAERPMPGATAVEVRPLIEAGLLRADALMERGDFPAARTRFAGVEAIVAAHAALLPPQARLQALRNCAFQSGVCLLNEAGEEDEAASFAALAPIARALDHADTLVGLGAASPEDIEVAAAVRCMLAESHLFYGEQGAVVADACAALAKAEALATADVPAVAAGRLADLLPRIAAARAARGCA
ncbi:AAA family ATPase [Sphingoaurantiacus capsulatus]|uniref:AAA family ATPase n=1 Tax=Sphingoaurantiacus capsulatus TaxID=1771310 RepID=A0ABV7XDX8_9SPHN